MPKREMPKISDEGFGDRMARLRKRAGYSQRDLAAEIGVSQRMIAYYEKETDYPPVHLIPLLVQVLGVSSDALLGLKTVKGNGRGRDNRLWRRFNQVEKLPAIQRKQIVQVVDAFLERERLKKSV